MYTTWPLLSALSRGGVGTGASEQRKEWGRERAERRYVEVYKHKIDGIEVHKLKNSPHPPPPCQTEYCLIHKSALVNRSCNTPVPTDLHASYKVMQVTPLQSTIKLKTSFKRH